MIVITLKLQLIESFINRKYILKNMPSQKALVDLSKEFDREDYVLAGGLAVFLHTGRKRASSDIDIIFKKNLEERLEQFSRNHKNIQIDVSQPDNYMESISFTPDLLERNTEEVEYKGVDVPCLSKEALLVSKLTSFCISGDQPISRYGLSMLRMKDVQDLRTLYDAGIDQDKAVELLGSVPQIEENDHNLFYVAAEKVVKSELPDNIVRNAYGIARIASLCKEDELDEVIRISSERLSTENIGVIPNKLDTIYSKLIASDNPLETYRSLLE